MTAKRAAQVFLAGLLVLGVLGLLGYVYISGKLGPYHLPLTLYNAQMVLRLPYYEGQPIAPKPMSEFPTPPPPGILEGQGWSGKRIFYSNDRLGCVTALMHWKDRYIVAGRGGWASLDAAAGDGVFTPGQWNKDCTVRLVREEQSYWFLSQIDWSPEGAGLYDFSGKRRYSGGGCCGPCVAGDLTGDGLPELVQNERYSLNFDDPAGKTPGWMVYILPAVLGVQVKDLAKRGRKEIACTTLMAQYVVCNLDGKVRTYHNLPFVVRDFCLSPWPDTAGKLSIITAQDAEIVVLNQKGRELRRFALPFAYGAALEALPVRLEKSEPSYFAVCGRYDLSPDAGWTSRGFFALFDPRGNLVYHEMTAEACTAVLAISQPSSNTEALLVGIGKGIWMFTAPQNQGSP